jgi:hypothetical protein
MTRGGDRWRAYLMAAGWSECAPRAMSSMRPMTWMIFPNLWSCLRGPELPSRVLAWLRLRRAHGRGGQYLGHRVAAPRMSSDALARSAGQ